jgi:hypothetical protein
MKPTHQSRKLNLNKKVIVLLNETQRRMVQAGSSLDNTACDTSMNPPCYSEEPICPKSTVPRLCPTQGCTTIPTATCTK